MDEHSRKGVFAKRMARFFGLEAQAPENIEQLKNLIAQSEKNGLLPIDVIEMTEGVLQVSDMRAEDVMIPSSQMICLDITIPVDLQLKTIIDSAHSRFPVIHKSVDKIEGVLLVKDLLHWFFEKNLGEFKINSYLRKPIFIPKSKRLNEVLRDFRDKRNHLALVVDEYGSTAGMITIEDVLEQIVGDITDEHDLEERHIRKLNENTFKVDAVTNLEEFNEYFDSDLALDQINSIGGFVVKSLGYLPKKDVTLTHAPFKFKILRADKRRVSLLQVEKVTATNGNNI